MRPLSVKNSFINLSLGTLFSVVLLSSTFSNGANAAEVGVAKRVKNSVIASQGNRNLSKNDAIHSGERISAKRKSHGELLLNDNTKIIVGENSTVKLDGFAISNGGIKKGTLRVAKGALRLITGNKAKKDAYTVKTPNATIGARGTGFDTYYNADGSTEVVLIQGRVSVCSSGGSCLVARSNCDIVRISRGGKITKKPHLRSDVSDRSKEDANYDLFAGQGKYASAWRLPTIGCDAKRNRKNTERLRKIRDARTDEPRLPTPTPTAPTPAPKAPAPAPKPPAPAPAPIAPVSPPPPDPCSSAYKSLDNEWLELKKGGISGLDTAVVDDVYPCS